MLYIVLPHAVACALLAVVLWHCCRRVTSRRCPAPLFLVQASAFLIPLLGIIGVICSRVPALYMQAQARRSRSWQTLAYRACPFGRWSVATRRCFRWRPAGRAYLATDPERRLKTPAGRTRRMPSHEVKVRSLKLSPCATPPMMYGLLAYSTGSEGERHQPAYRALGRAVK